MSLSIVAIELTLAWNHVSGIYTITSAGQIIPLTVGAILVLTVLWTAWERVILGKGRRRRDRGRDAPASDAGDAKLSTPLERIRTRLAQPSRQFRAQGWRRRGVEAAPPGSQNPPSGVDMPIAEERVSELQPFATQTPQRTQQLGENIQNSPTVQITPSTRSLPVKNPHALRRSTWHPSIEREQEETSDTLWTSENPTANVPRAPNTD